MPSLYPGLLALWALAAQAQTLPDADLRDSAGVYHRRLCVDEDPAAAEAFLKDQPLSEYLAVADPEERSRLFDRAARLKDYKELLKVYKDTDVLSIALRERLPNDNADPAACRGLGFGADPRRLEVWDKAHLYGLNGSALKAALWDWDTLSPAKRAWLEKSGARAGWDSRSYQDRLGLLTRRGADLYKALMAAPVRSEKELEAVTEGDDDILEVLSDDQRILLGEKIGKARAALNGIASLESRADILKSPEIQSLLAQAKGAGSVDDSLAALSRIFDRLGERNKAIEARRPAQGSELLSAPDRRVLTEMLAGALVSDIASSEAGRRVRDFYKTHPLKLQLKELPGRVGQFDPRDGIMVINDKLIMSWLKTEEKDVRSLASDPAALKGLAMILSASFVHEATHHRQLAWADENHLRVIYGQHDEMEAMTEEALFAAEQIKARPDYKKYLEDRQDVLGVCHLDLSLAKGYSADPEAFRRKAMVDYYPNTMSLEGSSAGRLEWYVELSQAMRDELSRRAKLPPRRQAALESQGASKWPEQGSDNLAQWLGRMKTSVLRKAIPEAEFSQAAEIDLYRASRARNDSAIAAADAELSRLKGPKTTSEAVPLPPEAPR